jgi:hypothetical protein
MIRSVKIYVNLLTGDNDIDLRNDMVDDAIRNCKWHDDHKIATDIGYEVLECDKKGFATLKATFNYE